VTWLPPLLRDNEFRRYWGAATISMFGDQVTGIAMPLVAVLVLDAHAAQMGYLTALQWVPSLLFGLHAGALADRGGRRRRVMITADLGRAVLLAAVPICFAFHVLALWQLYIVTFAVGTLGIFFNVSTNTLFVSLVRQEQYVDGQSLLYGSRAMSFVAGPSAGGLMVQVLTAPIAVVADARRSSCPGSGRTSRPPPSEKECLPLARASSRGTRSSARRSTASR
jgi:MFS family permease